ncbi:hypothetical protein E1263_40460 [Kribbella antibiotica]|uniref:PH domain-containing protein n=1 Tax=Kribbella antibiotica TaxID=190195 RepID=A0A4R4YKK9_9ACTN|nr:hypothetical protein [Kribbella antibiotica]TDD44579.1 hypothetical protein E1263_40460 [Kribbella antibiotica]
MRTTYRMRSGRFLGVLAVGLIILGVAAITWALGAPRVAVTVFLALGGLVALAGLWIVARPPVVLRLRDDAIEVRGVKTGWTDITEVGRVETTHGAALALRTKRADDTVLVPLSWLSPGQVPVLETTLRDKLNTAHGYTIWDGTAPDPAPPAE